MPLLKIKNKADGKELKIPLTKPVVNVGSGPKCDITLPKGTLAETHFQVMQKDGGHYLLNLSPYGDTSVDGQQVVAPVKLAAGSVVQAGQYEMTFVEDGKTAKAAPEPQKPKTEVPYVDFGKMVKNMARQASHQPQQAPPQNNQQLEFAPQQVPFKPAMPPVAQGQMPWRDGFVRLPNDLLKRIHQRLIEDLDLKHIDMAKYSTTEIRQRTSLAADRIISSLGPSIPQGMPKESIVKQVVDEALGLGPLEDLITEPSIDEVMVNGAAKIYVEIRGKIYQTPRQFVDDDHVLAVIRRIIAPLGRRIDESSPMVDARLGDGSRVNAIIHPVCLSGPTITIRKFAKTPFTSDDLVRMDSICPEMVAFCRLSVKYKKNILISGGTGSGKTTLLNLVSSSIPTDERIVTIEDAAELRLPQDHVISLEAKPPNIEGEGAVPIRKLVINALRMRPDRIIVGECRGGEALDMLQAMNTGHEGSLTTVHANSPRDAVSRIETMVLMSGMDLPTRAISTQIASAIHIIVHTARLSDGKRRVTSISAVTGMEGNIITLQELFLYEQTGFSQTGQVEGHFKATGAIPKFVQDLRKRGIDVDMSMFSGGDNQ